VSEPTSKRTVTLPLDVWIALRTLSQVRGCTINKSLADICSHYCKENLDDELNEWVKDKKYKDTQREESQNKAYTPLESDGDF